MLPACPSPQLCSCLEQGESCGDWAMSVPWGGHPRFLVHRPMGGSFPEGHPSWGSLWSLCPSTPPRGHLCSLSRTRNFPSSLPIDLLLTVNVVATGLWRPLWEVGHPPFCECGPKFDSVCFRGSEAPPLHCPVSAPGPSLLSPPRAQLGFLFVPLPRLLFIFPDTPQPLPPPPPESSGPAGSVLSAHLLLPLLAWHLSSADL